MFQRLFSEAFRIFFLLTLLAALGLMGLWEAMLWADHVATAPLALPLAPAALHWHGHEMLFGFGGAAVAGFLLTAVPNWTSAPPARPGYLAALAALWLAGRGAMLVSALLPGWLLAGVVLAFWLVLGAQVLAMLRHRPAGRNMVFVGLLAGLFAAQTLVQADWLGWGWGDAGRGLRAALLLLAALIAVVGGRIVPAFTRNALVRGGQAGPPPAESGRLDAAGRIAALLTGLALLVPLSDRVAGTLSLLAGGLALARLARWRGAATLGQPILWTLHASYALLGLGYLAWGLARLGFGAEVAALHLLAIGAVAGMVLSVLSRASLGHSGRPLRATPPLVAAYVLLPLAAVLRWGAGLAGRAEPLFLLVSGAFWLVAFGLALAALAPALLSPRADKTG